MDDIFPYLSHNLDIVSKDGFGISLTDMGFLYGFGIYETIAVRDGRPWLLDRHLHRFRKSADALGIPLKWSDPAINQHVTQLVAKNEIVTGVLNWYLTAGDRRRLATEISPNFYMVARQFPDSSHAPIQLTLRSMKMPPFGIHKTMANLAYVIQRVGSRGRDVLIINRSGYVMETTIANVVFVKKGRYITPRSPAILPGVVREYLMAMCRDRGMPWEFRSVHVRELGEMDEIGIINSIVGVQRAHLDGYDLASGPMIDKLRSLIELGAD